MAIIKVKISPTVLKWARESLHLPEEIVLEHFEQRTKKKFGVSKMYLKKIESLDGEEISFSLLKEFSKIYKRPLAVFFLNKPPTEQILPRDRRTIGSGIHKIISPAAVLAVRRAYYVQEVLKELGRELSLNFKFSFNKLSLSDNPAKEALKFRDVLDFSFESQKKIKDTRGLFDAVRSTLESMNIFTIKSSFPLEDARAFSFADDLPHLILVNNRDGGYFGYAPKTFSLLHEFAHILLQDGSICNDFTNYSQGVEKFCNSFAASFLVPDNYFWEALEINRDQFNIASFDKYINILKPVFKVSKDVILRKFLTLNLVDNNFYKTKVKKWKDEYEKGLKDKKKNEFFPFITPGRRVISNNGKKFVEIILNARNEGKITTDNSADYLGVSLKYVPEVEKLLAKSRHTHA